MPIQSIWRAFRKQSLRGLPDKAGVYELGDAEKQIVYIGSSRSSIRDRLLSHKEMKRFIPARYFRFKLASAFEDAREMEQKHCELFKKQHNGLLPRLQKSAPKKPWPWKPL